MRLATMTACVLAATGCIDLGSDVEMHTDGVTAKDGYEREFRWESPRPCEVFLHERITDEELRLVQYTLRIHGEEYGLLYQIDDGAELPIRATAFSLTGTDALIVEANDHDLAVYDATGALVYEVHGYDQQDAGLTRVVQHRALAHTNAVEVIGCALPARDELGAVPAFLRNLGAGGRLPGSDVVALPEEAPQILEWDSELSILGALVLQSACTTSTWACPCLRWEEPYTGPVSGWCGRSSTAPPHRDVASRARPGL